MKLPAATLALALPAGAQSGFNWGASQIRVTQQSGNACRPAITGATTTSGLRYLRLDVSAPVDGSITARLDVTLRQGTQSWSYSGSQTLNSGTGRIDVNGPVVPANLAGSTLEVVVGYCAIHPRSTGPATGGTM